MAGTGRRPEVGDLLHADLRFAGRYGGADWTALRDHGLALDGIRNAELLDHGLDMLAAGALAVTDGLRRHQRGLEFVRRADVRLRRAGLHGDAHLRNHQQGLAVADYIAARGKPVDSLGAGDDEVRGTLFDVGGDRRSALEADLDLVPGGALEHRHQRSHDIRQRAAARDNGDLSSTRRAGTRRAHA